MSVPPPQHTQIQPQIQPQQPYNQAQHTPNGPYGQQAQPPTPPSARFPPYQAPVTPDEFARERERASLLLEINQELLQHTQRLQAANQGGIWGQPPPPQQQQQQQGDSKPPSPEYVQYLRCIQANIAFCATVNSAGRTPAAPAQTLVGPAVMTAPPGSSPKLVGMYEKLQRLFPGWKGITQRPGMPQSQSPKGPGHLGQGQMYPGQAQRSPPVSVGGMQQQIHPHMAQLQAQLQQMQGQMG